MTDNNKHENKTEELIKKQEAHKLTEEELEQVNGGLLGRPAQRATSTGFIRPNNG